MGSNHKYKIVFFTPYFGVWPEWIDLYFETLRRNKDIDFIIYTDCDISKVSAPNIIFHKVTFDEYIKFINNKLDLKFNPSNNYKLCDLRPLFGYIHRDLFLGYDFYGWIDIDLLLGNIREFYTDEILSKYDVFSTHVNRISGHFALFRNNRKNRLIYKKIYAWREALQAKPFIGIDEHGITNAYALTVFDKINIKYKLHIGNQLTRLITSWKKRKLYMHEQFTTPFSPIPWIDGSINSKQPDEWYYIDGNITNSRDKDRKFIYLHFMNFKSSKWRHDKTIAPWENKEKIVFVSAQDMVKGIKINRQGFLPI